MVFLLQDFNFLIESKIWFYSLRCRLLTLWINSIWCPCLYFTKYLKRCVIRLYQLSVSANNMFSPMLETLFWLQWLLICIGCCWRSRNAIRIQLLLHFHQLFRIGSCLLFSVKIKYFAPNEIFECNFHTWVLTIIPIAKMHSILHEEQTRVLRKHRYYFDINYSCSWHMLWLCFNWKYF